MPSEPIASAEPAAHEPGLDWEAALRTVAGDRELLRKVVQGFLRQHSSLVAEVKEAVPAGDVGRAQRVAHTIGGSLRCFERSSVVACAERLEDACRAGDANRVQQAWSVLETELETTLEELRSFVGTFPEGDKR